MPESIFDYAASLQEETEPQIPSIFDYADQLQDQPLAPLTTQLSIFEYDDINRYGTPLTVTLDKLRKLNQRDEDISYHSDLKEVPEPGVAGAFGRGILSGLVPFGWYEPERRETLTKPEYAAEVFGAVLGTLPAFVLASAATGGYAAPAMGARTASAINAISRIGKASRQIDKLSKLEKAAKGTSKAKNIRNRINSLEFHKNKYTNILKDERMKFIESELKKGIPKKKIAQLGTLGLPKASGIGKIQKYQDMMLNIARSGPKGAQRAQWLNRWINNIGAFSAVGQIYTPFGTPVEQRLAGMGKDAIAATVFAAAAAPKIFGLAKAGLYEPALIFGAGAGSDLGLDKNMTMEDRFIHGLALLGVHYSMEGLNRVGVKQKAFNALVSVGVPPENATRIINSEKVHNVFDVAEKAGRSKGDVWRSKTNPEDTIFIEKGDMVYDPESERFTVNFTDSRTGARGDVSGPNKQSVLKELGKKWYRERPDAELLEPEAVYHYKTRKVKEIEELYGGVREVEKTRRYLHDITFPERYKTIITPEESKVLRGSLPESLKDEKKHWQKVARVVDKNIKESKNPLRRWHEVEEIEVKPPKVKKGERPVRLWDLRKWISSEKGNPDKELNKEYYDAKWEKDGVHIEETSSADPEGSPRARKDGEVFHGRTEWHSAGDRRNLKIKAGDNIIIPTFRGEGYGDLERSFDYNRSDVGRVEAIGNWNISVWMRDNPDKKVFKKGVAKIDRATVLVTAKSGDFYEKGKDVHFLIKVGSKSDFKENISNTYRDIQEYYREKDHPHDILPTAADLWLFRGGINPNEYWDIREAPRRGKEGKLIKRWTPESPEVRAPIDPRWKERQLPTEMFPEYKTFGDYWEFLRTTGRGRNFRMSYNLDSSTSIPHTIIFESTAQLLKRGEPIYFYIRGPKGKSYKISKADQETLKKYYKEDKSIADPRFVDHLIRKVTGGKGMTSAEYNELPLKEKQKIAKLRVPKEIRHKVGKEIVYERKANPKYLRYKELQVIKTKVLENLGFDKDAAKETTIKQAEAFWEPKEKGEENIFIRDFSLAKREAREKKGEFRVLIDIGPPYQLRSWVVKHPITQYSTKYFTDMLGTEKLIDPKTGRKVVIPHKKLLDTNTDRFSVKKFEAIRRSLDIWMKENAGKMERDVKLMEDKQHLLDMGELREADVTKLDTGSGSAPIENLRYFKADFIRPAIEKDVVGTSVMYKVKLKKDLEGKTNVDMIDKKQQQYLFGDNEVIFRTEGEAHDWARNYWGNPESANRVLNEKLQQARSKVERLNPSKIQKDYQRTKRELKDVLRDNNFNKAAREELIKFIIPTSEGNIDNLSSYGMRLVKDYIHTPQHPVVYESVIADLPPDNFGNRIGMPRAGKLWRVLKEVTLPVSTLIEFLGTKTADIIAKEKLRFHSRFRQEVAGQILDGLKDMSNNVGKKMSFANPMSEIGKFLSPWIDPKFESLKKMKDFKEFETNARKIKVMGQDGLDWLVKRHKDMMDELWKVETMSNVYIRDGRTAKFKPMAFLVEKKSGRPFEQADFRKDPISALEQAESWLQFAKKRTDAAKTYRNGRLVEVDADRKKSKIWYEENYLPRKITQRFRELAGTDNNFYKMMVEKIMATDKEIRESGETPAGMRRLAEMKVSEIKDMVSQKGVFGQQWTRIADLPPFFYVERMNNRQVGIIQVPTDFSYTKRNGKPYKAGDKVRDRGGIEHTIDEVVPVYETEYGNIMERHVNSSSHLSATYVAYSNRQTGKINYKSLADKLGREVRDEAYGEFAKKAMHLQVYGQEVGPIAKILQNLARKSALAGLSFPTSGIKNAMIGNVMNASVFHVREMMSAMKNIYWGGMDRPIKNSLESYKTARSMTRRIGAEYTGAYSLFLKENAISGWMQRWLGNLGLMRTTEFFNRTVSSTIGPIALKNHIHNFAGIKTPGNRGVSKSTSHRVLTEVFEFTPREIESMVKRYRQRQAAGEDVMIDLFNNHELVKASQQAHIVTQGSPDLPYVPYWMGQAWAKPLTLFYRIAYRMTDTVAKNVIKPIVTDGNMMPAMKYITGSVAAGSVLYSIYDWILGEERRNQFKSMPAEYLDYFMKAEGFALFSNLFDEYGGLGEAYWPVPLRNTEEFISNLVAWSKGEKTFGQAADDGLSTIFAAYNGYQRLIKNAVGDDKKRVSESRRRQGQFLDTFFPDEPVNIDYDDNLTTKTPYYRGISDVFWHDNPDYKAREYYTALAYIRDRIREEKLISYGKAEKEARERLKRIITRQRPIPSTWRKAEGRVPKFKDYMAKISEENRAEEKALDVLYLNKRNDFWKAVSDYRSTYYLPGE